MSEHLTIHDALIYVMVMASAVDRSMSNRELARIGDMIHELPVFGGFDEDRLIGVTQTCAQAVSAPEGLDVTLELIKETLPPRLYDTAYALAVDVVAVDQAVRPEEIRLLQMLRDRLLLDKLTCAAIERGAIARFRLL